jgi:hypothetical protein
MSLRHTRIGLPCSLPSMAQSPSPTSVSRRREGTEKPAGCTPSMRSEDVSLPAPRRAKRRLQTPPPLPWLCRGPNRPAIQAINACSRHHVRHVLRVCWRQARAARGRGAPQAEAWWARVACGCGAPARASAPRPRACCRCSRRFPGPGDVDAAPLPWGPARASPCVSTRWGAVSRDAARGARVRC